MKGTVILGSDTGVGKTLVASGLLRILNRSRIKAAPFKPVETGVVEGTRSDSERLTQSIDWEHGTPEEVTLYRFKEPLAPALAAERAGVEISLGSIVRRVEEIASSYDFVVIETAGGVLTPLSGPRTNLDLAKALGFPVVLVGRNSLGTISQTSLSINELVRSNLPIAGVLLSKTSRIDSEDQRDNARMIEQVTGMRVSSLPFLEDEADASSLEALADLAKSLTNF